MLKKEDERWKYPVLLGKGSFSEVYRVTDAVTGEFLVCKISPQVKLAQQEARLLEKVRHPIFPIYKGQQLLDDNHYLMMEYICGSRLKQYVEKRGCLSQERAVEIAIELAKGLNYLHEQSEPIIYRDLKPENVLIQQDGRVRLVDLGCAYMAGNRDGSMAGTRGYAAPEQLVAGEQVGAESDVYALGKLLYFMLTGQNAKDCGERIPGKVGQQKISRGLWRLLGQAMQNDPKQRIPDMRTFMQMLEFYGKKRTWRQRLQDRKSLTFMGTDGGFYYEKNIQKGL